MDPKALEECKHKLRQLRERLLAEVQHGEESILEAAQSPGEDSHLPTHAADHDSGALEANMATTQQQTEILEAVDAALERISAGVYGVCEECEGRIAPLRLEAIPYTPYCFNCASKLEQE